MVKQLLAASADPNLQDEVCARMGIANAQTLATQTMLQSYPIHATLVTGLTVHGYPHMACGCLVLFSRTVASPF